MQSGSYPTAKRNRRWTGRALPGRTQKFHEVPNVFFREHLPQFLRHPGETTIARFYFRFINLYQPVFRRVDLKGRRSFALENACIGGPILERHYERLEALGNLFIRKDKRFENVLAGLTRSNPGEVRADFGAFVANL